ncbi:MAG: PmoA family protein [Planctomycetaceae bacterium]|jgi:hypothetical protein|nr:PmoA family protein [Planctomycetaceae bacterium]
MQRRDFLKTTAILAGTAATSGLMSGRLFAQKELIDNGGEGPQPHLTVYPDIQNGKHQLYQLWVSKDNSVLTSYRAHQDQKYPFFYPFSGPVSGLSLTAEHGRPWPHHRSIFFGLDRVNGGNYWQDNLNRGQIISQGPAFTKSEDGKYKIGPDFAEITDKCLWVRPEQSQDPIIEDNRHFVIKVRDERRYILDTEINIKALVPVTVEKTNHGLFGVRSAHDLSPAGGGFLVNSEGAKGQEQTLGKPAKWLAFYGKRAGLKEEIVEGVAVFCPSKAPHPLFNDCPWFTRDYGNCSPTPCNFFPNDVKLELAANEELKLRYRIVGFAGTPEEADLNGLWKEFDAAV